MPMSQRIRRAALACAIALACAADFAFAHASRADDWLPVTPEELAATDSAIEPGAGAEILYRLKQVDDSTIDASTTEEYVRVKIYNAKGVDDVSEINIPYDSGESIPFLEARVIKPGGKIIDVEKGAFYDRALFKSGDARVRVRSFSFPALEPGAIVEYRLMRSRNENIFGLRFDFADTMPARRVVFRFKPFPVALDPGWRMQRIAYLCAPQKPESDKDGFYSLEMKNLKSSADEPFMPPANDVHPWMFYFPTYGSADEYWADTAAALSKAAAACVKKGGAPVRITAVAITSGLGSPGAQLDALNDFCRAQIVNIELNPLPGPRDPKLLAAKDPLNPADVLQTKAGRTMDIQMLFVALARSLGFDARPALCPRRGNGAFTNTIPTDTLLPDRIVAVRYQDAWHFYDPARREVDTGLLDWDNEGQTALIPQNKGDPLWQATPVAPPEKSRAKRVAQLQLDATGALSGGVRLEFTGQAACEARRRYMDETQDALEKKVRANLRSRMPGAEVSDVTASGMGDVLKPFVLAYTVRVPNYAEQSGRRMFVQPGFFTKGGEPRFKADTRVSDICFDYATFQEDEVSIKLPDGYSIEEGSAPRSIKQADWGRYAVTLGFRPKSRVIVYTRAFEYSPLRLPAADYDQVKKLFDFLHEQDAHVLTLKKDN